MAFQPATGLSPYPYPGLRPFQKSEADIFFGRDQQVDRLLETLGQHRFLAVLGPSGCGKSSLVRAGVIPALETGFMASAGYRWRTTVMRPGDSPLANLATALFDDGICHADHDSLCEEMAFLQATLKRGPLGLVEALQQADFAADENLLVLVDQFEELFRFERHGGRSESRAFVDILLASAEHPDARIYVVTTMRSEFLGQCPLFRGLPEAMNDSQFLTPRLTRDQIRDSIVGPASMFNTSIAPEVVTRILNSMGTDPDQLPLMQHLLMRMWRRAALNLTHDKEDAGGSSEDSAQTWDDLQRLDELELQITLTLKDYEEAGGLTRALSNHAIKTFKNGLSSDAERRIAEILFRNLTEINQDGHILRRPATVAEICAAAKIDPEDSEDFQQLVAVIDAFRAEGRSFLMPPSDESLTLETRLDISHESLIRQWEQLKEWTKEEDRFRKIGALVNEKAERWEESQRQDSFLLSGVDLAEGEAWRDRIEDSGISVQIASKVHTFLDESERRRDRATQAEQRAKYAQILQIFVVIAGLLAAVAIGAAIWARAESSQATKARDKLAIINDELEVATIEASATVARQMLEKAMRLMTDGDASGAMLWIQHALNQEHEILLKCQELNLVEQERELAHRQQLHRIRLGAGMAQLLRLADFWGAADHKVSHAVPSPNGQRVMLVGSCEGSSSPTKLGYVTIWEIVDARPGSPTAAASTKAPLTENLARAPWATLPHTHPVRHASWSPDGRFVITASAGEQNPEGEILLWDLDQLRNASQPHQYEPISLDNTGRGTLTAFSVRPESSLFHALAVVEDDSKSHTVKAWKLNKKDMAGGETEPPSLVFSNQANGSVNWVEFLPIADGAESNASKPANAIFAIAGADATKAGYVRMYDAAATTPTPAPAESESTSAKTDGATNSGMLSEWSLPASVSHAALSPDGRRLAAASEKQIFVFDRRSPNTKPVWHKPHHDAVLHVVFSPDSRLVVSSSRDHTAQVWLAENGDWQNILRHDGWIYSSQFSPDGRYVVSGGRDQVAKVWDVANVGMATPIAPQLHHAGAVQQAYFTADGAHLLTRSWNMVRLWSFETNNPPSSIFRSDWSVKAINRSENGLCVAMVSGDVEGGPWQVKASVVRIKGDSQEEFVFKDNLPQEMDEAWISEDGHRLLAAGKIKDAERIGAVLYNIDDKDHSEMVQLALPKAYEGQPIKLARFLQIGNRPVLITVRNFAASPDPSDSAPADKDVPSEKEIDCLVQLWDGQSGALLSQDDKEEYPDCGKAIFLAVSSDTSRVALVTALEDNSIKSKVLLWNIRGRTDGKPRLEALHPDIEQKDGAAIHAAFDRTGNRLLTTSNSDTDGLLLWDIEQDVEARTPLLFLRHTSDVSFVGFSDETARQNYIISGSYDNTAKIWVNPSPERKAPEVEGEVLPLAVLQHEKSVSHATFDPDGKLGLVATSSRDGATRLWDVETGELVALFPGTDAIECASFVPKANSKEGLLIRTLSRGIGSQYMRIRDWHIEPLSGDYEPYLSMIAARKILGVSGKERLKPTEKVDQWMRPAIDDFIKSFPKYRERFLADRR